MIKWISESQSLPNIGETVLLSIPNGHLQRRITTAMILVRYDGVEPHPVNKGDKFPRDFYWNTGAKDSVTFITGNSFWARLNELPNPEITWKEKRFKYVIGLINDQKAILREVQSNSDEDWTDVLENGDCPVDKKLKVNVMFRNGNITSGLAGDFMWHLGFQNIKDKTLRHDDIIAYKIYKEE